ncbi:esterase family protein [Streptomyces sp. 15-116A]|uniref:alpha/beta hydrolase n=1 Tax=Streptomyces sp. 15-116A TaxID=2259035 RepID=UPI0021B496B8|nr:esterase family protein [Streptomyces sp. 15-116A]MCT7352913.1 esterase family protein [Streptomyces sp. 15-116A]
MSLTGTPFLCTLAVLSVLALGLPLVLWTRVRGPRAVRAVTRVLMLLFAQLTAVALVFTLVNNANQLYDDWGDLLGTADHVEHAADLGADGTGGVSLERLPRVRQAFKPAGGPGMRAAGGVRVTKLEGRVSGVRGEVYVWLPPQYDDPAWRDHRFPVVELLPGYPGSAKAWFGTLDAHEQLLPLMRSGRIAPFILVAPRTNLLPGADTGCANLPGKVNADSWLSVDVPRMVMDNFRAQSAPRGWAVAGYSAGGHCATRLAVAHPDRYRAAVSLSGYNDPAAERTSLTGRDPALRAAHNPLTLLREAVTPPKISLYLSGQQDDGYEDALALGRAAKAPTSVQVVKLPKSAGGHTMALWKPQVVPAFRWLTEELAGHRTATDRTATDRTASHRTDVTPPGPSNAGATRAAPASGSASPAAAARTR